jgi:hypothetical protein
MAIRTTRRIHSDDRHIGIWPCPKTSHHHTRLFLHIRVYQPHYPAAFHTEQNGVLYHFNSLPMDVYRLASQQGVPWLYLGSLLLHSLGSRTSQRCILTLPGEHRRVLKVTHYVLHSSTYLSLFDTRVLEWASEQARSIVFLLVYCLPRRTRNICLFRGVVHI